LSIVGQQIFRSASTWHPESCRFVATLWSNLGHCMMVVPGCELGHLELLEEELIVVVD
jgi:hypothetical protein